MLTYPSSDATRQQAVRGRSAALPAPCLLTLTRDYCASVGESAKLEQTYSSGERFQTTRCTAHSYRRICIPDCHGWVCFFLDGSSNSDDEYEKQCNATSNQPLRFPDIGDRLSSLGLRGLRSLDDVRTIWWRKHKPRRDFFPFEIICCCTIWASIQRLVLSGDGSGIETATCASAIAPSIAIFQLNICTQ